MGKAAARKKTTTTALGDVERSTAVLLASQQLISSSISMGWQLALTVLVPVFIGVTLDKHFDTSPSYTLAALFLAIGGAVIVIKNTISNVSQDQSKKDKKK